ncbi:hypothetical protein BpHYR1_002068 [Brachionus plicatilis]|uniref:Uncharacterized protein n=1 Tax=Brachionus plicatilis TaxID=10195 RepID=A0A3M7QYR5_BRAPC|nr:hypothetical protein BpHYR1_002068 [Brachionus plicatilis]
MAYMIFIIESYLFPNKHSRFKKISIMYLIDFASYTEIILLRTRLFCFKLFNNLNFEQYHDYELLSNIDLFTNLLVFQISIQISCEKYNVFIFLMIVQKSSYVKLIYTF